MGPVRMLFPLAALVACQPAPRSAAPDELTRLSEDLALYDVSFARSHQVVELVERWAGDAPVLVHVDIEDATVTHGGDAPGVWTDVTLRVHEVLRDDLEELAQDDLILLTVPGGDDGEERVVSTDAPLFYPGDSALVTLDLIDDELALSGRITEALAQLAWWGRSDRLLRDNIAKLREGEGIADLLADGDDAATLLEQHSARFPGDEPYQPNAEASTLRDLAARVRAGQIGFHNDTTQARLVETRNRAFAWCDELLSEVRAAGRFVFRKDPAVAARFASGYVRRKNQRRDHKPANPAPGEA